MIDEAHYMGLKVIEFGNSIRYHGVQKNRFTALVKKNKVYKIMIHENCAIFLGFFFTNIFVGGKNELFLLPKMDKFAESHEEIRKLT